MEENELFYTLSLQKIPQIGPVLGRRLLEHFGSAETVFQQRPKELSQVLGIGDLHIKSLLQADVLKNAEQELLEIERHKWSVYSVMGASYPILLKECCDAPLLLFCSKPLSEQQDRILSIVGARNASSNGIEFCKNIVEDLKSYKPTIVSGFAYGIDIAAHIAALENGLITFAVLGHGLNQIYPREHESYVERMNESGGFITEFWSSDEFNRENFIRRNRIIAGMSKATLVIESALRGGSLNTVRFANDYNRDVYAVPGRITDLMSKGCNDLIKTNRAAMLTEAKDIINGLNWKEKPKKVKVLQPELFLQLNDEEQRVYDSFKHTEKAFMETIASECNMAVSKVSSVLLNLEIKGLVRPLPGNYYECL